MGIRTLFLGSPLPPKADIHVEHILGWGCLLCFFFFFHVELHLGQRFLPESDEKMVTSFLNWFQLGLRLEKAPGPDGFIAKQPLPAAFVNSPAASALN